VLKEVSTRIIPVGVLVLSAMRLAITLQRMNDLHSPNRDHSFLPQGDEANS
jgi:hypothetical protein